MSVQNVNVSLFLRWWYFFYLSLSTPPSANTSLFLPGSGTFEISSLEYRSPRRFLIHFIPLPDFFLIIPVDGKPISSINPSHDSISSPDSFLCSLEPTAKELPTCQKLLIIAQKPSRFLSRLGNSTAESNIYSIRNVTSNISSPHHQLQRSKCKFSISGKLQRKAACGKDNTRR